jgi:hypothetical protein
MVRLVIQEFRAQFPRERRINIEQTIGKPFSLAFRPGQEKGVNASMFELIMTIGKIIAMIDVAGNELPLTIVGKKKTKRCLAGFQLSGDVWGTFSERGRKTSYAMARGTWKPNIPIFDTREVVQR